MAATSRDSARPVGRFPPPCSIHRSARYAATAGDGRSASGPVSLTALPNHCAAVADVFRPDPTAMALDNTFADGQPQAGPWLSRNSATSLERHEDRVKFVCRYARAVVLDADAVAGGDDHVDLGAIAGQGLVDGVVDHFVDEMMEAAFTG